MRAKTLPKRTDVIVFGIADRADQVLLLAEQSPEPQRTQLQRLALELERQRCNLLEIIRGECIGNLWFQLTRSAASQGGIPDRMSKYRDLRAELDPEVRYADERGPLRLIQGGLS